MVVVVGRGGGAAAVRRSCRRRGSRPSLRCIWSCRIGSSVPIDSIAVGMATTAAVQKSPNPKPQPLNPKTPKTKTLKP